MQHRCECTDPECPVDHGSRRCGAPGTSILFRRDTADADGTVFCEECGDDALDSGLFMDYGDDDGEEADYPPGIGDPRD